MSGRLQRCPQIFHTWLLWDATIRCLQAVCKIATRPPFFRFDSAHRFVALVALNASLVEECKDDFCCSDIFEDDDFFDDLYEDIQLHDVNFLFCAMFLSAILASQNLEPFVSIPQGVGWIPGATCAKGRTSGSGQDGHEWRKQQKKSNDLPSN